MPFDDIDPEALDFIVNWNDGIDTIHRNPGLEECNLDDAVERSHIDPRTAAQMIASGHAKACQHCLPLSEAT